MAGGFGTLSGLAPIDPSGIAYGTGTGQHGVVAQSNPPSALGLHSVVDWLKEPFTSPLSASNIFLLTGIILVSIVLWNLILFHIRLAAETI
jgi:hypothetical protein